MEHCCADSSNGPEMKPQQPWCIAVLAGCETSTDMEHCCIDGVWDLNRYGALLYWWGVRPQQIWSIAVLMGCETSTAHCCIDGVWDLNRYGALLYWWGVRPQQCIALLMGCETSTDKEHCCIDGVWDLNSALLYWWGVRPQRIWSIAVLVGWDISRPVLTCLTRYGSLLCWLMWWGCDLHQWHCCKWWISKTNY